MLSYSETTFHEREFISLLTKIKFPGFMQTTCDSNYKLSYYLYWGFKRKSLSSKVQILCCPLRTKVGGVKINPITALMRKNPLETLS